MAGGQRGASARPVPLPASRRARGAGARRWHGRLPATAPSCGPQRQAQDGPIRPGGLRPRLPPPDQQLKLPLTAPGQAPSGGGRDGAWGAKGSSCTPPPEPQRRSPRPCTIPSAGERKSGSPRCWSHRGTVPRLPLRLPKPVDFFFSPPPIKMQIGHFDRQAPLSPRLLPERPGLRDWQCGAVAAESSLAPLKQSGKNVFEFTFKIFET